MFPGGGGARGAADGNPALNMGKVNKGLGYPLAPSAVPKDGSNPGPNPDYTNKGAGAILGRIPPNGKLPAPKAQGKTAAIFRA